MPTEAPHGTWMTGADGRRWFFDSGSTALDFAYSGDLGYGRPEWETLREPSDLDTWLAVRFGEPSASASESEYAEARALRTAISLTARAVADGLIPHAGDIDTINAAASGPALAPELSGGTAPRRTPTIQRMLAEIAQDAVRSFSADPGRLRRCSADDCGLIFLDTSRPGSRRWCSMSRCGGRAKTRAHYNRHRNGD